MSTTPAVRAEVARLLDIVLTGLSADAMARISRMDLRAVEAVLAELDRSGAVVRKPLALRGGVIELWARR